MASSRWCRAAVYKGLKTLNSTKTHKTTTGKQANKRNRLLSNDERNSNGNRIGILPYSKSERQSSWKQIMHKCWPHKEEVWREPLYTAGGMYTSLDPMKISKGVPRNTKHKTIHVVQVYHSCTCAWRTPSQHTTEEFAHRYLMEQDSH